MSVPGFLSRLGRFRGREEEAFEEETDSGGSSDNNSSDDDDDSGFGPDSDLDEVAVATSMDINGLLGRGSSSKVSGRRDFIKRARGWFGGPVSGDSSAAVSGAVPLPSPAPREESEAVTNARGLHANGQITLESLQQIIEADSRFNDMRRGAGASSLLNNPAPPVVEEKVDEEETDEEETETEAIRNARGLYEQGVITREEYAQIVCSDNRFESFLELQKRNKMALNQMITEMDAFSQQSTSKRAPFALTVRVLQCESLCVPRRFSASSSFVAGYGSSYNILGSKPNPRCRLKLEALERRTSRQRKTTQPVWDSRDPLNEFTFPFTHPSSLLHVEVYDAGKRRDTPIGTVAVSLEGVGIGQPPREFRCELASPTAEDYATASSDKRQKERAAEARKAGSLSSVSSSSIVTSIDEGAKGGGGGVVVLQLSARETFPVILYRDERTTALDELNAIGTREETAHDGLWLKAKYRRHSVGNTQEERAAVGALADFAVASRAISPHTEQFARQWLDHHAGGADDGGVAAQVADWLSDAIDMWQRAPYSDVLSASRSGDENRFGRQLVFYPSCPSAAYEQQRRTNAADPACRRSVGAVDRRDDLSQSEDLLPFSIHLHLKTGDEHVIAANGWGSYVRWVDAIANLRLCEGCGNEESLASCAEIEQSASGLREGLPLGVKAGDLVAGWLMRRKHSPKAFTARHVRRYFQLRFGGHSNAGGPAVASLTYSASQSGGGKPFKLNEVSQVSFGESHQPPMPLVVKVHVSGCSNLRNTDIVGKSDPYCVITLRSKGAGGDRRRPSLRDSPTYAREFAQTHRKRQWRTEIIDNDLNPAWEEDFAIPVRLNASDDYGALDDADTHLLFGVYDFNSWHSDDYLGMLSVPLNQLRLNRTIDVFEPLSDDGRGNNHRAQKADGGTEQQMLRVRLTLCRSDVYNTAWPCRLVPAVAQGRRSDGGDLLSDDPTGGDRNARLAHVHPSPACLVLYGHRDRRHDAESAPGEAGYSGRFAQAILPKETDPFLSVEYDDILRCLAVSDRCLHLHLRAENDVNDTGITIAAIAPCPAPLLCSLIAERCRVARLRQTLWRTVRSFRECSSGASSAVSQHFTVTERRAQFAGAHSRSAIAVARVKQRATSRRLENQVRKQEVSDELLERAVDLHRLISETIHDLAYRSAAERCHGGGYEACGDSKGRSVQRLRFYLVQLVSMGIVPAWCTQGRDPTPLDVAQYIHGKVSDVFTAARQVGETLVQSAHAVGSLAKSLRGCHFAFPNVNSAGEVARQIIEFQEIIVNATFHRVVSEVSKFVRTRAKLKEMPGDEILQLLGWIMENERAFIDVLHAEGIRAEPPPLLSAVINVKLLVQRYGHRVASEMMGLAHSTAAAYQNRSLLEAGNASGGGASTDADVDFLPSIAFLREPARSRFTHKPCTDAPENLLSGLNTTLAAVKRYCPGNEKLLAKALAGCASSLAVYEREMRLQVREMRESRTKYLTLRDETLDNAAAADDPWGRTYRGKDLDVRWQIVFEHAYAFINDITRIIISHLPSIDGDYEGVIRKFEMDFEPVGAGFYTLGLSIVQLLSDCASDLKRVELSCFFSQEWVQASPRHRANAMRAACEGVMQLYEFICKNKLEQGPFQRKLKGAVADAVLQRYLSSLVAYMRQYDVTSSTRAGRLSRRMIESICTDLEIMHQCFPKDRDRGCHGPILQKTLDQFGEICAFLSATPAELGGSFIGQGDKRTFASVAKKRERYLGRVYQMLELCVNSRQDISAEAKEELLEHCFDVCEHKLAKSRKVGVSAVSSSPLARDRSIYERVLGDVAGLPDPFCTTTATAAPAHSLAFDLHGRPPSSMSSQQAVNMNVAAAEERMLQDEANAQYLLEVEVVAGQNLAEMDISGKSDPYCELGVHMAGSSIGRTHRTQIIKRNLHPIWCEKFEFKLQRIFGAELHCRLFDWDKFTHDDFMGYAAVPLACVELAEVGDGVVDEDDWNDEWFALEEGRGRLRLKVRISRLQDDDSRGQI